MAAAKGSPVLGAVVLAQALPRSSRARVRWRAGDRIIKPRRCAANGAARVAWRPCRILRRRDTLSSPQLFRGLGQQSLEGSGGLAPSVGALLLQSRGMLGPPERVVAEQSD